MKAVFHRIPTTIAPFVFANFASHVRAPTKILKLCLTFGTIADFGPGLFVNPLLETIVLVLLIRVFTLIIWLMFLPTF